MLQSMGSQRVGHDLATEQQQIYFYETNYSKPPNLNGLKQQISVSLSLWVSFGRQFSFAFLQHLVSILFQTIFERMYSKEPRKTESFLVAQAIKSLPAMSETQVQSLGQEDPLEEEMETSLFLPGESHGQRSLAGYNLWVANSRTHD